MLSRREISFTTYSVIGKKLNGEYKPNTLHKLIFWISSQVTHPDGIAQYTVNNSVTGSGLGTFNAALFNNLILIW
jgi:hypothetical protein